MTQDIIYSLKTNPQGNRIVWRDDSAGVRVLFHRDGTQLLASAVTFDGDKFDSASASRWLTNRISQYALNSQIANLTPYEDALLASLVEYKPEFAELALKYKDTPAMTGLTLGSNCLFDWKAFIGEKTVPLTSTNKPKSTDNVGLLNSKNEIWNVSKQIERKMKSAKVGSVDV